MRRVVTLLTIVAVAGSLLLGGTDGATTKAAGGSDWRQFRGPGGLGRSNERGVPLNWSAQENVIWKAALPGPGTSSPVVAGNMVFLTCYTGYGERDQKPLTWHVLCFNLLDGELLWDHEVSARLPELPNQGDISYALAGRTPAADDHRLYVHFGKTGVFAFDHKGQQLWQADIGQELNGYGVAGSPVLYRNLVILNASAESQSLVALDQQTGKEVWKARSIVQSSNTPLLVELALTKTELVLAIEAQPQSLLVGFDPANGEQLWSCAVGKRCYMVPSPVANDGVVYCIWAPGGGLSAAVLAGGRGDVTKTHLLWQANRGSNVSSPVYHDGYLYFAREDGGIVVCLDAKTGNTVYQEQLTPAPVGKIYASPVLIDGRIYYVSQTRGTFVVAAKPDFEQLTHNDLGDTSVFNASPAVSNGRLLLRSDRYLYCIGEK